MPGHRIRYGVFLYDLITSLRLKTGLELTCFQSLSTAYIAGALAELGGGHLRTFRHELPKAIPFDLPKVLKCTKLAQYVELQASTSSYNIQLLELIAMGLQETFEFCIIDQEVSFSEVGFAVCLCERLLTPGGWIIFSDMITPFGGHYSSNTIGNCHQPTLNGLMLFQALKHNPYFASFQHRGCFGWAQKTEGIWSAARRRNCEREAVLCDLRLRAHHDPEFRFSLLNDPRTALRELPEHLQLSLRDLRFVELPGCFDKDNAGQIFLSKPDWENVISEESLEAMVKHGLK
jgi:hypothetical protein